MDDFTIYGDSFDNCLHNLTFILQRCIETNLVLNSKKCHFMVEQGIVLGHVISSRGIEVDKAKVDTIQSLPYPTSVQEVHSFLGHAGFTEGSSRTSLKHYPYASCCKRMWLLSSMRHVKKAFEKLKELLTSTPLIQPPD